jgi:hypothetical protein
MAGMSLGCRLEQSQCGGSRSVCRPTLPQCQTENDAQMAPEKDLTGGGMKPRPASSRLRRPFFAILVAMAVFPRPVPT